ncbi:DNA polymerase IV [Novosphingobium sp. KACC 22771]|uniref:DNA polymerase IV n=1 Tax=Novosphingobium sp. KACC 22771 TaxID=3025670 RepID=UPI0023661CF7|nr:DNA polymerase IV [Novosphingobium sp. KACC 22771]WDF71953.1 DNA polymerase IV [Novosphingobium sp. KACC 22771]
MESVPHQDEEISAPGLRKIIHVDMDAFFASVEQRDDPSLRGLPVAVGGSRERGVVAAASYEARKFGVRSAQPSVVAVRLCPALIFKPPRFEAYRKVSQQIRAIFRDYTPLVEPLAMDEAYLDVTQDVKGIGSATRIAELIRARIRAETGLTASAGVSYNKFLAKIASDQNKPDGLCVIRPGEGADFVAALPVRRFHGVGPRGAEKMAALGIETGADLRARDIAFLREHFGSLADYLYRAARAIDLRAVKPNRPRKSLGGERTFDRDISTGPGLRQMLEGIIEMVWHDIEKAKAQGRTITLKLRLSDFSIRTHSRTLDRFVEGREEFAAIGRELLDNLLPLPLAVRLMGLTLSGFEAVEAPAPVAGGQQMVLF